MWIRIWPNWQMNFNSKNSGKRSFFNETKASMSFIPMSRISLWYPNMKRKEIIMWIHVCPNWLTNYNLKIVEKKFFYKTKGSMSFILMSRTSLWCQIMKRNEIIMWIYVSPSRGMNYNFKKWQKEKVFLWNQSINVIYPNE